MDTSSAPGARRSRSLRRSSVQAGLLVIGAMFAMTACPADPGSGTQGTTTTIDPAVNHAPVIASFAASHPSGPSPLTTALQWSISDPDGQPLTCTIDLDENGSIDRTINGCTSDSVRSVTYSAVGSTAITLHVSDGSLDTFAATVVTVGAASADAFNITLRLNGTMTPSQQAAFTDAAARWAQVVRTGLPNTSLTIPANDCGTGAPAFNGAIDDVVIDAAIAPIDGEGEILGQAGPCWLRNSGGLPMYGVMKFDVADVADLESAGDLDAVILHEMGHVLGFGTVWDGKGLVGAGTGDPRFTGATARGTWQAIGGTGNVPVEWDGGPGTADSHWREGTFNGELMTGWIDHDNNPLSAVTIGALADLGYGVDLGAADPYGLPALRSGRSVAGNGFEINTELILPKGSR